MSENEAPATPAKLINWDKVPKIGLKPIDDDHEEIINITNELDQAISQSGGAVSEAINGLVDQLIEVTGKHFQKEEILFEKVSYTHIGPHTKEHVILLHQLKGFAHQLKAAGPQSDANLRKFLKHWLIDHIDDFDVRFALFLKDKVRKEKGLPAERATPSKSPVTPAPEDDSNGEDPVALLTARVEKLEERVEMLAKLLKKVATGGKG